MSTTARRTDSARGRLPVLWGALAFFGIWVLAGHAEAQGRRRPPDEAVERYRIAYEHYREGRYQEAIVDLEAALALDPESPTLVYNLARVHELLGELEPALTYYRLYAERLPRGERRERTRIARAIARIEGALAAAPPEPEELDEPRWPGPPLERPPPREVRGVADAAFWVTGLTGVALLVSGGVLGVLALDARREVDAFVLGLDGDLAERAELVDRADRLSLAADISLAAGGVAVLSAVLLYALRTELEGVDDRSIALRLGADPLPGGAAVTLGGTF